ncbi:cystathionine gamma-synthase [Candidatus Obscuribacterales bacterium]|nr:cystathionine gamma-synthase [Candidatus Obscuribacterales bacterium]
MSVYNQYPNNQQQFSTRAIHAGQDADPSTGALNTPIFQTSTFVLDELGVNKGYQYARTHNPTRTALEQCIASLENAKYALASASGLSAAYTVTNLLSAGDHVIVGEDVYGGVYRLFEQVLTRYGLSFTYVNARNIEEIEQAINEKTRLVWIETPTNPLLRLADIRTIADLCHANGLRLAVDNTFATPYFQRPLELGADVIIHSTTKYLGGHSDVIGGAIVTSSDDLYERLQYHNNAVGAVPGPFDCFLVLRGLKTLKLRMREHERNAFAIAKFLESHPNVETVHYPGLATHPQHELAAKQMSGFGGMVSFVVKGGIDFAANTVSSTNLFQLAESLGGVKSLICHPATMTHKPIPKEIREHCGIVDGLIRLSPGIEEAEDLIADLDQALSGSPGNQQSLTNNGTDANSKLETRAAERALVQTR